jgi:hypothetical protein
MTAAIGLAAMHGLSACSDNSLLQDAQAQVEEAQAAQAATAVATPTFSPGGGSYASAQSVALASSTSGASIRYTTDGSAPSETAGELYSDPIQVSSNSTLNAIAYRSGLTTSAIGSAGYSFVPPAAPTISAATGGDRSVAVAWGAVSGALAYKVYWLEGGSVTTGSGSSAACEGSPQTISSLKPSTTYSFIVTAVGTYGESAATPSKTAITYSQVSAAGFGLPSGNYNGAQGVSLNSSTQGASICYTIDGTSPAQSGGGATNGHVVANGATVSLPSTATLTAIAFKQGWTDSAESSARYVINQVSGTISVTQPQLRTVTISGPSSISYGTQYAFTSSYSGTAVSYAWYLDTSVPTPANALGTSASLTVTPTTSSFAYGAHILWLVVADASGVSFDGSYAITVGN